MTKLFACKPSETAVALLLSADQLQLIAEILSGAAEDLGGMEPSDEIGGVTAGAKLELLQPVVDAIDTHEMRSVP